LSTQNLKNLGNPNKKPGNPNRNHGNPNKKLGNQNKNHGNPNKNPKIKTNKENNFLFGFPAFLFGFS
jgi:hypothetical protein